MEHIKNILAARKASLFADHEEKGAREWSVFNSVRGDTTDMFPVAPMRAHHPEHKNPVHAQKRRSRQLRLQFGAAH
jgi:hypothetical protein